MQGGNLCECLGKRNCQTMGEVVSDPLCDLLSRAFRGATWRGEVIQLNHSGETPCLVSQLTHPCRTAHLLSQLAKSMPWFPSEYKFTKGIESGRG